MMVLASIAPMNLTGSHCGQIVSDVEFELLYTIDFKPNKVGSICLCLRCGRVANRHLIGKAAID